MAAPPSDEAGGERTPTSEDPQVLLACLEEVAEEDEVVVALLEAAMGAVPLRRLLRLGPPTNLNSRGVWTWAIVKKGRRVCVFRSVSLGVLGVFGYPVKEYLEIDRQCLERESRQ